ncbi:MAG TPA: alpha/beta fold hydrolase [Candidatus Bilamarchaeum sp.]|nr:alpha/beta fold hydrolase [Candidatus Bilamarchaeum sp.]
MEEFIDSPAGKVCIDSREAGGSSAAILTHGYHSAKESRTNTALAPILNARKISTFAFDMYGHGKSEGDISRLTVSKVVENALVVYDHVKSMGYTKIAFAASSFSGQVALISATKRPFSALALRCPVFDGRGLWDMRLGPEGIALWKRQGAIRPFGIDWKFEAYEDEAKYDMHAVAAMVEAPTVVIHGDRDATVPISQAESLIAALKCEKKLVVVRGADHFFAPEAHFREMVDATSAWLTGHL